MAYTPGAHQFIGSFLKGENTLSERQHTEAIVGQYYQAINSNDISSLPLTEDAEFIGILTPEPVQGEAAVRQYLQETAPFMLNVRSTRMIIENGAVASLTQLEAVNGVHVEGTIFFDIENGKIRRIRGVFDTRAIFAGTR